MLLTIHWMGDNATKATQAKRQEWGRMSISDADSVLYRILAISAKYLRSLARPFLWATKQNNDDKITCGAVYKSRVCNLYALNASRRLSKFALTSCAVCLYLFAPSGYRYPCKYRVCQYLSHEPVTCSDPCEISRTLPTIWKIYTVTICPKEKLREKKKWYLQWYLQWIDISSAFVLRSRKSVSNILRVTC